MARFEGMDIHLTDFETLLREYGMIISFSDFCEMVKQMGHDKAIAQAEILCDGSPCVVRKVINECRAIVRWIDDGSTLPEKWSEMETVEPILFTGSRRQCHEFLAGGIKNVGPSRLDRLEVE